MNKSSVIKIDEIANPVIGDLSFVVSGLYTRQGNPKLTGRILTKGKDVYYEVSFELTTGIFFKKKIPITEFIHEKFIKEDLPGIISYLPLEP